MGGHTTSPQAGHLEPYAAWPLILWLRDHQGPGKYLKNYMNKVDIPGAAALGGMREASHQHRRQQGGMKRLKCTGGDSREGCPPWPKRIWTYPAGATSHPWASRAAPDIGFAAGSGAHVGTQPGCSGPYLNLVSCLSASHSTSEALCALVKQQLGSVCSN